jgi:putative copper resistance protein D
VCFAAVAASARFRDPGPGCPGCPTCGTTGYGGLLLAKASLLVALGAAGCLHRRRTVAAVVGGAPGAFARLAAAEVGLMTVALGLAVALTRTSP